MKDRSTWKRMMFKGHKVWLCVDANAEPIAENGKVLIKYQLDQDYEYWVPDKAVQPVDPARLKKKASVQRSTGEKAPKASAVPERISIPPGTVLAYTDGASSGNPGPAGVGIVLRFGSDKKEISRYIGIATNNVAELMAIRTALGAIRKTHIPVRLYTDSQYCHGVLVRGWKARQNQVLVAAIKKIMSKFKKLEIVKTEGHAGIADNERADSLARTAAKKGPGGKSAKSI